MDIYLIYLRKSRSDNPDMTVEEVLKKHETILQEYAMREFGNTIPEGFIYREVVSGETISDRPMMQEVMRIMEIKEVRGVLVVEPQRLSRGDLEDCGRIVNIFRYTNTLVLTPNKTYNISDEYDRKFFEMELTRGNDYLEYTKKILNRGRYASVKRGNYIASVAPYGYERIQVKEDNDNYFTLKIIESEASVIRMMYDMYVHKNMGFRSIANELDRMGIVPRKSSHWSSAAIKDMLENPVYNGMIRWNWRKVNKEIVDGELKHTRPKTDGEIFPGKHPAIIDDITFKAALNRRNKRIAFPNKVKCRNPYAGLLYCQCGKAMSYKPYTTTAGLLPVMLCNDQAHCKTRSVQYEDFNARVISILETTIENFRFAIRNQNDSSPDLNKAAIINLQNELDKIIQRDHKQKDAFEEGIYTKDEYLLQNSKLQKRKQEVTASLIELKNQKPLIVNYQDKISNFTEAVNSLNDDSISPYDKNVILKKIISRIVYINKSGIGNRWTENSYELDIFFCE